MEAASGYLDGPHGRVWYEVDGSADGVPVVVVHGGPGFGHEYLKVLDALRSERPVVYYDQLGCGKSDRPDDASLWNVQAFADELGWIRRTLHLDQCHLVGHSIGAAYIARHVLDGARGLVSAVLESPYLSASRWNTDQERLRSELPDGARAALATGETDSTEYQAAVDAFNAIHWCRIDPLPEVLQRAVAQLNQQMAATMYGPNPFRAEGNLAELELVSDLLAFTAPALVTNGRYDQVTPETARAFATAIPDADVRQFDESGHMAHLREPDAFLSAIREFLRARGA